MDNYLSAWDTEYAGETGGSGSYVEYSSGVGAVGQSTGGGAGGLLDSVGGLFSKAAGTFLDVKSRESILKQNSQYGVPYFEGRPMTGAPVASGMSPMLLLLLIGGFVLATRGK